MGDLKVLKQRRKCFADNAVDDDRAAAAADDKEYGTALVKSAQFAGSGCVTAQQLAADRGTGQNRFVGRQITCPLTKSLGSRLGFSRRSCSTFVPLRAAISSSVSPS